MDYNSILCAEYRNDFRVVYERIQPIKVSRELTTNEVKFNEYKQDIISTYNVLISYYANCYVRADLTDQAKIKDYCAWARDRLQTAFEKLELEYDFPSAYVTIDPDLVRKKSSESQGDHSATTAGKSVDFNSGTQRNSAENLSDSESQPEKETVTEESSSTERTVTSRAVLSRANSIDSVGSNSDPQLLDQIYQNIDNRQISFTLDSSSKTIKTRFYAPCWPHSELWW